MSIRAREFFEEVIPRRHHCEFTIGEVDSWVVRTTLGLVGVAKNNSGPGIIVTALNRLVVIREDELDDPTKISELVTKAGYSGKSINHTPVDTFPNQPVRFYMGYSKFECISTSPSSFDVKVFSPSRATSTPWDKNGPSLFKRIKDEYQAK